MASVFLSYRREDSRADAGRLYDRLSRHFGPDNVFMDIDDIVAGENFVEKLTATLKQCDLLLLVIGPRWLTITDEEGHLRLASPNDFVRTELQSALERGIALIPVLVGGARMPERGELPSQLADVVVHQAIQISDERFHEDVNRLIAAITRAEGARGGRRRWRHLALYGLPLVPVVVAVLGYFLYPQLGLDKPALRSAPVELSVQQAKVAIAAHDFYDRVANTAGKGVANDYVTEIAGEEIMIVDRATGLAWQKGGSRTALTYDDAVALVATLNEQRPAGFDDWRLPTLEEAMSIMEPQMSGDYYLDPVFERSAAPFVWTSDAAAEGRRWVVYYHDGIATSESPELNAYARLVRSHPR